MTKKTRNYKLPTREQIVKGGKIAGAVGRERRLADPKYQAKIAKVKAMRAQGTSIRYCAEHYGVSFVAMRNFMKANNIPTSIATENENERTDTSQT